MRQHEDHIYSKFLCPKPLGSFSTCTCTFRLGSTVERSFSLSQFHSMIRTFQQDKQHVLHAAHLKEGSISKFKKRILHRSSRKRQRNLLFCYRWWHVLQPLHRRQDCSAERCIIKKAYRRELRNHLRRPQLLIMALKVTKPIKTTKITYKLSYIFCLMKLVIMD